MMRSYLLLLTTLFIITACNEGDQVSTTQSDDAVSFVNKAHELVFHSVQQIGSLEKLKEKKDVVYTYTYATPDGLKDVSTEKYLFEGELSYGIYETHERSYKDLEGAVEQSYDGNEFWLRHAGEYIEDSAAIERVAFIRPTNYYWFAMFQKLLDPGLKYESVGEKEIDGQSYDVVKIGFTSANNKPTDIYQIYINKNTLLIDQFLFTVADYGVMEEPFLMEVEYEEIEGIKIPSKRRYKKSNWDGDVLDGPWVNVTWSDIKFNNGLSVADFKK